MLSSLFVIVHIVKLLIQFHNISSKIRNMSCSISGCTKANDLFSKYSNAVKIEQYQNTHILLFLPYIFHWTHHLKREASVSPVLFLRHTPHPFPTHVPSFKIAISASPHVSQPSHIIIVHVGQHSCPPCSAVLPGMYCI